MTVQVASSPAAPAPAPASPQLPGGATRRAELGAVALLAALAGWRHRDVLLGSPGVLRTTGYALERSDQLLHAWILDWVYHRLPRAPLRLFDAGIFWPHPDPLALSDHLFGVAMTLVPVRLLTAEPLRVNAIGTVLTFVLAGVAVWAVVTRLTGNRTAALAAGVLYAFNPFRLRNLDQIQLLTDYATPVAFLFLHRFQATGRVRDLLGVAVAVAWQVLCSAYLGAYLAPALAAALVWGLLRGRPRRTPAWAWIVAAAAGAVLVAPFLWPYAHLRAMLGLRQHLLNAIALSLPLDALACVRDCPSLLGSVVSMPVALAAVALWPGGRTGPGVRATYVLVALVALALSLGPYVHRAAPVPEWAPGFLGPGPYFAFWRWVPGIDGLRAPIRAVALVHFAVAVLAGCGVARVASGLRRPAVERAWSVGVLALAAAWAALAPPAVRVEAVPGLADAPPVYAALAADPDGGPVVELPMRFESDTYTYYASVHRRPLVNGYSGVLPYSYRYIEAALVCYPCAPALAVLGDLDVRTHVLHLDAVGPAFRDDVRARIAATPALAVERVFGDTLLLRFTPPPRPASPVGLVSVPRTGWQASSSRGPTGAGRAIDGDARSGWSSAPELDALEQVGTGTRLVRGVTTWAALLGLAGPDPQWWAVDLGTPHAVRRATVRMSAWGGFLPQPAPTLEGSDDGAAWRTLESMPAVLPSLRAFTRSAVATFAYDVPAAPVRYLRLRYAGPWTLYDFAVDE